MFYYFTCLSVFGVKHGGINTNLLEAIQYAVDYADNSTSDVIVLVCYLDPYSHEVNETRIVTVIPGYGPSNKNWKFILPIVKLTHNKTGQILGYFLSLKDATNWHYIWSDKNVPVDDMSGDWSCTFENM